MADQKIHIVLDRLRSAYNVGNLFRIAEAVGAAEVIGCGCTPLPPHPKLAKTAMGTEFAVPSRRFGDSLAALRTLRAEGCRMILAAEPGPGSRPVWEAGFRYPLAVVFGNEALGVLPETLAEVDGCIELPMLGTKSSINVGNAAAAILFSIRERETMIRSWRKQFEDENQS